MSRRALTITYETPACALVKGFGARELLTDLHHGRSPVWMRSARAWVMQPSMVKDLIALAETKGYDVTVMGGSRQVSHMTHLAGTGSSNSATPDEQEPSLW